MTLERLLRDPRYNVPDVHTAPPAQVSRPPREPTELYKNEQFQKQRRLREQEEGGHLLADTVDEEQALFCFGEEQTAVCQLELELPRTGAQWRAFNREDKVWAAQMLRKSEVKWSSLDAKGREEFQKAKMLEVDQWIQAEATKAVQGHIDPQRSIRMRWVLTYKESGAAKARIVLIGFEDPDLDTLVSSSPTMCRRTRQLILQYAAQKGWKLLKADIKSAFLQGPASQESRQLFAIPVKELADAMKIPEGQAVQVRKAAYGLVNAPAEFYKAVDSALKAQGFVQMKTEPCGWLFKGKDPLTGKVTTLGVVVSHVDDFIICGCEQSPEWNRALAAFYEQFRWSPCWEHSSFMHCGLTIKEAADGSKILDHSKFCETLEQVPVAKNRDDAEAATPAEVSQLRAILGAAQWRAYNSGPQHSAKVGLLLSQVGKATVRTLREANKLAREIHGARNTSVRVNYLPGVAAEEVVFICWTDGAVANRKDLSSTGGHVVAATSPAMLHGEPAPLTLVAWRSHKLQRIARSSLSAEIQAFSEGEEELMYVRLCWAELCGYDVDTKDISEQMKAVPGTMVTDAKSLYDVVRKGSLNTAGLGLRDKYSTLEMLSVLERLERGSTLTRWVNSEAQLADALTKPQVSSSLHKVLQEHMWTLVYDERFVSAKKCRKLQQSSPIDFGACQFPASGSFADQPLVYRVCEC